MDLKRPWIWFVAGGFFGYVALHPLVMISAQFMSFGPTNCLDQSPAFIFHYLRAAFSIEMLPWGLSFFLLSGFAGMLIVRSRIMMIEKSKLEAVMELAGAACHELNQPLQAMLGYAALLAEDVPQNSNLGNNLEIIIEQVDKMNVILTKIRNITKYETLEYVNGVKIVDIEKSSKR